MEGPENRVGAAPRGGSPRDGRWCHEPHVWDGANVQEPRNCTDTRGRCPVEEGKGLGRHSLTRVTEQPAGPERRSRRAPRGKETWSAVGWLHTCRHG